MLIDEFFCGPGSFQRGQRIEDDPTGLSFDEGDLCEVETTHLVDARYDFVETVVHVQLRHSQQRRMNAVDVFRLIQKLVTLQVPCDVAGIGHDLPIFTLRDETPLPLLEILSVRKRQRLSSIVENFKSEFRGRLTLRMEVVFRNNGRRRRLGGRISTDRFRCLGRRASNHGKPSQAKYNINEGLPPPDDIYRENDGNNFIILWELPPDLTNAFYYFDVASLTSFISFYDVATESCLSYKLYYDTVLTVVILEQLDIPYKISAILSSGLIYCVNRNKAYIYDFNGNYQYLISLGDLEFNYEIWDQSKLKYRMVFTHPFWTKSDHDDYLNFNIYSIPTEELSKLR